MNNEELLHVIHEEIYDPRDGMIATLKTLNTRITWFVGIAAGVLAATLTVITYLMVQHTELLKLILTND